MTWPGDSAWRRFMAWLGQTAILIAIAGVAILIVMQILLPNMIQGLVEVFQNSTR